MSISQQFVDDVAAALSDSEGRRPNEIQKIVGRGAARTVRLALAELIEEGRASFTGKDGSRRYFKAQA